MKALDISNHNCLETFHFKDPEHSFVFINASLLTLLRPNVLRLISISSKASNITHIHQLRNVVSTLESIQRQSDSRLQNITVHISGDVRTRAQAEKYLAWPNLRLKRTFEVHWSELRGLHTRKEIIIPRRP